MDLGIRGRGAIVCASTGGLGAAIAAALVAEGANVLITGRDGEQATARARELTEVGPGRALGMGVDLLGDGAVQQMVQVARRELGSVDIAVLNGPGPRPGTAQSVRVEDVDSAVAALVRPHVELINEVLPDMVDRGWGRIVAVGSSGVAVPLANLALSNLGRAGLASYLKTLATEVAPHGVTVNMVLPGRIDTDRVAALDQARAERLGTTAEAVAHESRLTIPLGRYGTPAEFAAVAAFLASDAASYVTGVALRCDGGLVRNL